MLSLEHPTLFVAGLVALVAGSVYLVVANEFRHRISQADSERRRPLHFFALWWACLGINITLGGAFYLAASLGFTDFALQSVYSIAQRILLAVSLVGLMYYLLYLITDRGWLKILVPYYAAYFLFIIFVMYSGEPDGVLVGEWRTDLHATQENPPIFGLINFAMLIVPPVTASLVYFFRFFSKADDRALRYRIALVSWSVAIWWAMAVVAGQREAFGNDDFQLINRFTGLVAALAILAAYRPPQMIRRWLEKDASAPQAM